MNKILKIENLTKNFGSISAVSNVNLEVEGDVNLKCFNDTF